MIKRLRALAGALGLVAALARPAQAAPTAPSFGEAASVSITALRLQHLNVRDFLAKCDGVTDDSQAFNNATSYAVNHPLKGNSGWEVDVPAGLCVLNSTWTINFLPNTSLFIHGDGSANTQLQFNGGINGLYVTMNQNPGGNRTDIRRQGLWPGQAFRVSGMQFEANTGIIPAAASGASNTTLSNQAGYAGTAISVIGMAGIGASFMAPELFDDIVFTNSKGWYDGANNWAGGLYLQDMSNVRLERILWTDTALQNNVTSVPIWYHSTGIAPAGGQGNFNVTDALIEGGNTAIKIDGQAIQGVVLDKLFTVGVKYGVSWLVGPNQLTGSLIIENGSIGATMNMVLLNSVSTVFSHHNFYYNTAPPQGTNPVFFSASGGTTVESDHDTFYGPLAGWEGTGYKSTAIFYSGYGSANVDPSQFSDDIITHFDNGVVASGGPVAFDDIEIASDTGTVPTGGPGFTGSTAQAAGTVTGVCYRDSGTSSDPTQHPIFTNMHCGRDTYSHDGLDLGNLYEENTFPRFAGGLNIGAPGVTSPASAPGAAAIINLHSMASSNGTYAGLNAFDVQLAPSSGTQGTNGQGILDVIDQFTRFNSPVLVTDVRYNGFTPPATSSAACNAGDSGDGPLGSTYYHFYCTTTNTWGRVALTIGGW